MKNNSKLKMCNNKIIGDQKYKKIKCKKYRNIKSY